MHKDHTCLPLTGTQTPDDTLSMLTHLAVRKSNISKCSHASAASVRS